MSAQTNKRPASSPLKDHQPKRHSKITKATFISQIRTLDHDGAQHTYHPFRGIDLRQQEVRDKLVKKLQDVTWEEDLSTSDLIRSQNLTKAMPENLLDLPAEYLEALLELVEEAEGGQREVFKFQRRAVKLRTGDKNGKVARVDLVEAVRLLRERNHHHGMTEWKDDAADRDIDTDSDSEGESGDDSESGGSADDDEDRENSDDGEVDGKSDGTSNDTQSEIESAQQQVPINWAQNGQGRQRSPDGLWYERHEKEVAANAQVARNLRRVRSSEF